MKMVLLAAGHGRRFGGLKQLAPVGPGGESLIDYTVNQAARAGYDGIVLVVREEIRRQMSDHARRCWPRSVPVDIVVQGPTAGTVPAVLAAGAAVDGPFAVANADDLYDESVFSTIEGHFSSGTDEHVLIGYRLAGTVMTTKPVKRGLCVIGADGRLEDLVEHHVCVRPDGAYDAVPLYRRPAEIHEGRILLGDELVSMNLWGFSPRVLEHLERAEAARAAPGGEAGGPGDAELLLPEVLGQLVREGREAVKVVESASRCIGLTHHEDVALVEQALRDGEPQRELERAGARRAESLVMQGDSANG